MTSNSLMVPPSIALVTRTPRWRSQLRQSCERLESSPHVHWLLDLDSIHTFLATTHCDALLAELPADFTGQPTKFLNRVVNLCNNAQQCPLFLLADESVEGWQNLLCEAGATETCCSMLDFHMMWQRVERHLKNCRIEDLTVEERVAARLPW